MDNVLARLYRGETDIDFIGRRKIWFTISGLIMVAYLITRLRQLGWSENTSLLAQALPGVAALIFLLCTTSFAIVLTPGGDPISMLLIMFPLILLYEASILLARRFGTPSDREVGASDTPAGESA